VARATNQAERCIRLDQVAGRRVEGPAVLFEMSGPMDYLNRLDGQCPGLSRLGATATVSVASGRGGGLLCRGDRIRVLDPVEARATGALSYPTCILANFVPLARPR
jgi:hypothetical protein